MLQHPTCVGLRVRTPADAHIIFHAVSLGILPMVTRRLDTDERRAICSGSVFVWEERGPNAELTGLGIERWTDSISWGPSRVRDEFLFYHEKRRPSQTEASDSDETPPASQSTYRRSTLVKQTYSVYVETYNRGRRKWHMIAYFTHETLDQLRTIDDLPQLGILQVPPGVYRSARISRANFRVPKSSPAQRAPENPSHLLAEPSPVSQLQTSYLPPLKYLEALQPRPRHPVDERALNALCPFSSPSIFPVFTTLGKRTS